MTIQSIIDFDVSYDGSRSLRVKCDKGDIKQNFTGNKLLIKAVSQLIPEIRSENLFVLDEANSEIRNSAWLEIEFKLPRLFGIAAEKV